MKKILYFYLLFNINIYSIINQNVLICGVCKNVAKPLPYTIKIMESIGNLFQKYQIIVYENNSTDNTAQLLKNWASKNSNVKLYSENLPIDFFHENIINLYDDNIKKTLGTFFVPELIARARNFVLEKAMSDKYKEFDYIIWMDMDFKIMPNLIGIIEVFKSKKEWDAVFANGIHPNGNFYDWYALRNNKYLLGGELLGKDWWQLSKKSLRFNANDNWHPVYSAFGGCGIYKKSSIIGCKYSALANPDLEKLMQKIISQGLKYQHPDAIKYLNNIKKISKIISLDNTKQHLSKITNRNNTGIKISDRSNGLIWRMDNYTSRYPGVCEHVTFHASMILSGHDKLFINPRMIFIYN